jgi:phospholipase C
VPARNYILDLPRWLRTLLKPAFGGDFARLKAIDEGPRDYARYGFRVPAVVVSPHARPDYVHSETLDHTSVLKLIEEKWNLPPLTRRDAAAESPLDAVDLDAEPAFAQPPKLPEPAVRWGSWGRQPKRQRVRDLKWRSVRRTQHRTTQHRTTQP